MKRVRRWLKSVEQDIKDLPKWLNKDGKWIMNPFAKEADYRSFFSLKNEPSTSQREIMVNMLNIQPTMKDKKIFRPSDDVKLTKPNGWDEKGPFVNNQRSKADIQEENISQRSHQRSHQSH